VGAVERGGPGSGHFGHEGRPGQRGGSQPGEGGERRYEIDADRAFPRGLLQHYSLGDVSSWRDRLTDVLTTSVDSLHDKYVPSQVPPPNSTAEATYDRLRYAVAGLKDQMGYNAIRPGDARMQKVGVSSDDYWILRDGTLVPIVLHEQSATEAIKILLATGDMPKEFFQGTDFSGEAVFRALGFARWSVSGDQGLQFSDEVPLTGQQIAVIQALAADAMAVDDLNWETEELEVVTHESAATGKPRVFIGERNGREGEGIPAFLEFSPTMRSIINRGGEGSGHFGHLGRPGQVGGSQPSGVEGRFSSEEEAVTSAEAQGWKRKQAGANPAMTYIASPTIKAGERDGETYWRRQEARLRYNGREYYWEVSEEKFGIGDSEALAFPVVGTPLNLLPDVSSSPSSSPSSSSYRPKRVGGSREGIYSLLGPQKAPRRGRRGPPGMSN
jgi:hypothetical protein